MNILKAFLLTILLVAIELAISYPTGYLIDMRVSEIDSLRHCFGLLDIVSHLITYFIILLLIFKMKINWENGIKKTKSLNFKLLFYLLILNIGIHFFERPFFDFSKIIDTINNITIVPCEYHPQNSINLFYRVISLVIVAPILEELFFRKYMLVALHKKYSLNISILISSICFSLIHLPSYRNLIPTLIFGIITSIIYVRTKNILYPIILHFLSNLTWFILIIYGDDYYKWILKLEFNYIYWIMFLFGTLMILFGLKKITTANNS